MATTYEFVDSVSTNNSLSWSDDNRLALCTDTSIKILRLESTVKNSEPKLLCHQSSILVHPDVLDIPQYTSSEYLEVLHSLPKADEMQLIIDKILNPFRCPANTTPVTGFVTAAWSPVGTCVGGGCVLVTLSRDYRLMLYTQRTAVFKWFEVCDLSKVRIRESQPGEEFKDPVRYNAYKHWCYQQAYTVVAWNPVLHTDTSSELKYAVLVAGTKTGDIVVWKMHVPTDTASDCQQYTSFVCHQSQVTDLCWSGQSGTLAIGYLDGRVYTVQIDLTDPSTEPPCQQLHKDSDLLRVSPMAFLPDKQSEGEVLLACKEDLVLGFYLDQQHTLVTTTHVASESSLQATGMCSMGDNSTVLLSYLDGVIQKLHISTEKQDLKLSICRVEPQLPTFPYRPTLCQGLAVSPSHVLVAFLLRPTPSFDHLEAIYKTPTKVQIGTPSNFSESMCRNITFPQLMQRLQDETCLLGTRVDLVELLRQNALSSPSDDTCCPVPEEGTTTKLLKLHRYALLVQLHQMQNKQDIGMEKALYEGNVSKVRTRVTMVTAHILARHIHTALQRVDNTGAQLTQARGVKVLRAMQTFLEANTELLQPCDLDLDLTRERLTQLLGQSQVATETKCAICSCNLSQTQLHLKCDNGHIFDQCCQTLQPCEGVDYCKCRICGALSLSPEQLKEYDWLGATPTTCALCEATLAL